MTLSDVDRVDLEAVIVRHKRAARSDRMRTWCACECGQTKLGGCLCCEDCARAELARRKEQVTK
jgi:hypothetical protein